MPRRSTRANPARASATHDPPRRDPSPAAPNSAAGTSLSTRRSAGPQKPSIYTISQKRLDTLLRRAEKEGLVQYPGTIVDGAAGRSIAGRRPAGSRPLTKAERSHATIEGLRSADRLREMNFQAHWDVGSGSEETTAGLPDNDLLRAIHHHAAEFYHDQGLMYPKIKRSNERGWYTLRKRRMLSEQGGLAEPVPDEDELPPSFDLRRDTRNAAARRLDAVSTSAGQRGVKRKAMTGGAQSSPSKGSPRKEVKVVLPLPRGWSRVPRGSTAGPLEEEADSPMRAGRATRSTRCTSSTSTDEDEFDTDGESEYRGGRTDSEDDSAREQDVTDDAESVIAGEPDDGLEMKRKYKSKQREMHRALDGSALLAIGILVEEHILAQLHQAGYRSEHEEDEPGGSNGAQHESQTDGLSDDDDIRGEALGRALEPA